MLDTAGIDREGECGMSKRYTKPEDGYCAIPDGWGPCECGRETLAEKARCKLRLSESRMAEIFKNMREEAKREQA